MTLDQLKERSKMIEAERERKIAVAETPIEVKTRRKKKKKQKETLSFDDEFDDGETAAPAMKKQRVGDELEGSFLAKRLAKNPDVDTSFLPDHDREETEVVRVNAFVSTARPAHIFSLASALSVSGCGGNGLRSRIKSKLKRSR